MRVASLIAGAGGMYCGSCLRDNRLASVLLRQGRDVVLLPLYTPIRTDEHDVSAKRVYYGGLSVYLQQRSALFRRTPRLIDRLWDAPALLRGLGRFAARTKSSELGAMTVSILWAERGAQVKELHKLVDGLGAVEPSLIQVPNLMFAGVGRYLREALRVPVLCSLAGEDIFLDSLPEPHRSEAFQLIREAAVAVDGFIAPTRYYAAHAAEHFGLDGERVHYVPMGVAVDEALGGAAAAEPFTIGYLARLCPEKGLGQLCDAFAALRAAGRECRLRIAGYLGEGDRPFWRHTRRMLEGRGLAGAFEYLGEVDLEGKCRFLRSLHVLSVPATYRESKGLYLLEAMACGVPVVQPVHGSFPELIEATGGGLLYEPAKPAALVQALGRMMDDPELRANLGAAGRAGVLAGFTEEIMADRTWALYRRFRSSGAGDDGRASVAC